MKHILWLVSYYNKSSAVGEMGNHGDNSVGCHSSA